MMWGIFRNAFIRKLAYVLVGLLMALAMGKVHADTQPCYHWVCDHGGSTDPSSCASATFQASGDAGSGLLFGGLDDSGSCGGTPGNANAGCSGTYKECFDPQYYNGQTACSGGHGFTMSAAVGQCPGNCNNLPNKDLLSAIAANSSPGSSNYCVAGCEYTNGNNTITIGGGGNRLAGQAVSTGNACGASNATDGSNCFTKGGKQMCVSDTTQMASVNSDLIPMSAPPPDGQCVAYASGGVMCTVPGTHTAAENPATLPPVPAPPGPDDGTEGQPATPDAVVTGGGKAVNYYTPATVAASKGPVATAGTGAHGTGPGGSSSGAGTGTGNGDCTAGGDGTSSGGGGASSGGGTGNSNCASDAGLPGLDRTDTIQSNVQDYIESIKAAPIYAAMQSVASAWPAGSCPSLSFTIFGKSFDLMTSACTIWDQDVAGPLGYIFLAIWSIWGIRTVLSA